MVQGGGGEGLINPMRSPQQKGTANYLKYCGPFDPTPVPGLTSTTDQTLTAYTQGSCIVAADYRGDELIFGKTVVTGMEHNGHHKVRCNAIWGLTFWDTRGYYSGRQTGWIIREIGSDSIYDVTHAKNRSVSFQIEGQEIFVSALFDRAYSYHFDKHILYGSPFTDDLTANYTNNAGGGISTINGTVSEDIDCTETELVHLDLRYGAAAWRSTRRTFQFEGVNDVPVGTILVDDGIGLQTRRFLDTTLVDVSHNKPVTVTEKLSVAMPGYTKTLHDATSTAWHIMKLGISDFSGANGLAYDYLHWDWVGIVDESKPYTTGQGYTYFDLVDEPIEAGFPTRDYFPEWLDMVSNPLNQSEKNIFATYFGSNTTNLTLPCDIYPAVDVQPQGSWAHDRTGNLFISQIVDGPTNPKETFNLIKMKDGEEIDPVPLGKLAGTHPRFYPVSLV